jgi:hypothetical protein
MPSPTWLCASAELISLELLTCRAACFTCAALLVCLRNWVYLVCVGYKVARRLALLAFHGPLERLNGTLLTFLGTLLGLWQALGYAALDLAVDVALLKLQVGRGHAQSGHHGFGGHLHSSDLSYHCLESVQLGRWTWPWTCPCSSCRWGMHNMATMILLGVSHSSDLSYRCLESVHLGAGPGCGCGPAQAAGGGRHV